MRKAVYEVYFLSEKRKDNVSKCCNLHQYLKVEIDFSYWESYIKLIKASSAQKMKFSIKDFFSKSDKIRSKLRIWSL